MTMSGLPAGVVVEPKYSVEFLVYDEHCIGAVWLATAPLGDSYVWYAGRRHGCFEFAFEGTETPFGYETLCDAVQALYDAHKERRGKRQQ